jgi:hypothetical protein
MKIKIKNEKMLILKQSASTTIHQHIVSRRVLYVTLPDFGYAVL